MTWTTKGIEGPPLSMLQSFYKQRMSVASQKTQATSIVRRIVIAGEGFSKLGVLLSLPPFFLVHMVHATNGGFDT
jgi:hypothetical protein